VKIVHVGDATSIFVPRWAQHFASRGDEVHIIGYEPAEVEGVRVHTLPKATGANIADRMHEGIALKKLLDKIKPDIVHAHYTTKYAWLATLADYHPLIVQVWGSDMLVETGEVSREKTKKSLESADAIVTASQHMAEKIADIGFTARVYQIGIDLSVFNGRGVGERGKDFVIFSPRGRSPHYRQENIEEAVCLLITTDHNVDYLRLLGDTLPAEVMADRYQCSDAVVSIPYTDQFSSCLQEAMACGCTPIVADLPAYHEHLEHGVNARYVSSEASPEDIAREILWCMSHPEDMARYRSNNRVIAEREFNWGKCIKRYEELYDECAAV